MQIQRAELRSIPGTHRLGKFFRELSPEALREFELLEQTSVYPPNTVLFLEKDIPRGIFILHEGQMKLSIGSSDGKKLVLRIAGPGDLLDMTAAISGTPYELTAETVHSCKIAFIRREDFLRFLAEHPDAYQNLACELSLNYQRACEKLRAVVLSSSVSERLARLLLEWSNSGQETERGTRVKISMTHEEIGEFIGTSRETVTRTLSDFKHRKLVMLQGSTLMISNRVALENFARA
jgi:CRP/FNR family transcriptional regulator, cyclic AMP receptor protein